MQYTHGENGQREVKYLNGEMVEAYKWLDFLRLAGFHDGEVGYNFAYDGDERMPSAMQHEDRAVAYLYYDPVRFPTRGCRRVLQRDKGNPV